MQSIPEFSIFYSLSCIPFLKIENSGIDCMVSYFLILNCKLKISYCRGFSTRMTLKTCQVNS